MAYSTQSETASSHLGPIRPIPYNPPPLSLSPNNNNTALYQNMDFSKGPPQLPPKSHIPPPYRPPPTQFFGVHAIEDPFHKGVHTMMALSSSDGGSHDSHNDSGYCVRGSGGPSPSLSG